MALTSALANIQAAQQFAAQPRPPSAIQPAGAQAMTAARAAPPGSNMTGMMPQQIGQMQQRAGGFAQLGGGYGNASRNQYGAWQGGAPRTGLIGSEQALMGGLRGSEQALGAGARQGLQSIQRGVNYGQRELDQAQNQANAALRGRIGDPSQGLGQTFDRYGNRAMNQLGQDITFGLGGADQTFNRAGQQIQNQLGQAYTGVNAAGSRAGDFSGGGANAQTNLGVQGLNRFADPGAQAQQQQAALSGALGPEAQKQAYAGFQSSPGQQYLREQAEQATLRNAAATGGLGGGLVQQELQRQAIGMAAQDFDASFNRMGSVADRGMQAQGQVGQLRGAQAGIEGQLAGQRGAAQTQVGIQNAQNQMQAALANQQLRGQLGQTGAQLQAGLAGQLGGAQAATGLATGQEQGQRARQAAEMLGSQGAQLAGMQLQGGTAQMQADQARRAQQAQIATTLGQQSGQMGFQAGGQAADLQAMYANQLAQGRMGIGGQLSQGRTMAGQQIAGNVADTTNALAQLQNAQGMGFANLLGQAGGNAANLLQQLGMAQGQGYSQLQALLANAAMAQGTQVAGLPGLGGATPNNALTNFGNFASGVGTGYDAIWGS